MKKALYLLTLLLLFVACKEESEDDNEFPNWQADNTAFFNAIVDDARAKIAAGDKTYALFLGHTIPEQGHSNQNYDYIVVKSMKADRPVNTASTVQAPFLTDTVQVHYIGQLKPSAKKYRTTGMVFDRSFAGDLADEAIVNAVATPAAFSVQALSSGFATAVMHMEKGDYWRVWIPYQMGYGAAGRSSIPGYSTLIFDIRLANFWHKK